MASGSVAYRAHCGSRLIASACESSRADMKRSAGRVLVRVRVCVCVFVCVRVVLVRVCVCVRVCV